MVIDKEPLKPAIALRADAGREPAIALRNMRMVCFKGAITASK